VAVVVVTAATAIVVPAAGRIGRINRSHGHRWRIHLVRGCSRHPRPPLSHPPSSDWVDLPLPWALAADLPSPRPPLPSSLDWADLSLLWVLTVISYHCLLRRRVIVCVVLIVYKRFSMHINDTSLYKFYKYIGLI
jgi:hypothetical protein